jgi:cytochrome P450
MQQPASTGSRKLEDHLVSPAFVRDPYPALAHLRETDPVHWSDSIGGWLLTRYDDVVTGFKDVPAYSNEGRLGKAAEHLPADERMELAGFEAHYRSVLERMPDLRLVDREPDWALRKANSRVLNSLPVAF